jgi:hypothetical protein
MVDILIHLNKEEQHVWSYYWNMLGMYENWKNIVSLCIMDSNQYKGFLMLLEACVSAIDLPILQGLYVKQGDMYGSNYYL